jgi:hypothetical protein
LSIQNAAVARKFIMQGIDKYKQKFGKNGVLKKTAKKNSKKK